MTIAPSSCLTEERQGHGHDRSVSLRLVAPLLLYSRAINNLTSFRGSAFLWAMRSLRHLALGGRRLISALLVLAVIASSFDICPLSEASEGAVGYGIGSTVYAPANTPSETRGGVVVCHYCHERVILADAALVERSRTTAIGVQSPGIAKVLVSYMPGLPTPPPKASTSKA